MTRRILLAATLTMAFCMSFGIRGARANGNSDVHESKSFTQASNVQRIALDVCSDARTVSLRITLEARRGSISWRLIDPTGVQRDNGTVDGTRGTYETKNLNPESGQWMLEIKTEDASGSYDVRWRVR